MSKTNKELAVEVAIAAINANPKINCGRENAVSNGLSITSICNAIESVYLTLEKIDNHESKK
ncbi:hypothetical protein [Clostridium perfringens]|uniref:hypothetical protein n=1 Tax=Clostridium perfringens TaxID=1502 RepID=UPI003B028EB8